jgi:hypothetical protein
VVGFHERAFTMNNTVSYWKDRMGRLPVREDLVEISIIIVDGIAHYRKVVNRVLLEDAYLNEGQVRGLRRFYKKCTDQHDRRGWSIDVRNKTATFYRVFAMRWAM